MEQINTNTPEWIALEKSKVLPEFHRSRIQAMLNTHCFDMRPIHLAMPDTDLFPAATLLRTPAYRAIRAIDGTNYREHGVDVLNAIPAIIKLLTGIDSLTAPEPRPDPAIGEVAVGEPTTGGTIPSVTLV